MVSTEVNLLDRKWAVEAADSNADLPELGGPTVSSIFEVASDRRPNASGNYDG
jgi:hypothetical protein